MQCTLPTVMRMLCTNTHFSFSPLLPPSYRMGTRGSFPGGKDDHSPTSSVEVKEFVELYLHSPNTPSCVVLSYKARRQLYLYRYLTHSSLWVVWIWGLKSVGHKILVLQVFRMGTGLWAGRLGFDSRQGQGIFLIATSVSIPALDTRGSSRGRDGGGGESRARSWPHTPI
jgi:hypothetical protein